MQAQKKIIAVAPHCYEVHTSGAPLAAPCTVCGAAGEHHLDPAVEALGLHARAALYSVRGSRVVGKPAHTWCLLNALYSGDKTTLASIAPDAPADVFARANNPISKIMPVLFALAPASVHSTLHPTLARMSAGESAPLGDGYTLVYEPNDTAIAHVESPYGQRIEFALASDVARALDGHTFRGIAVATREVPLGGDVTIAINDTGAAAYAARHGSVAEYRGDGSDVAYKPAFPQQVLERMSETSPAVRDLIATGRGVTLGDGTSLYYRAHLKQPFVLLRPAAAGKPAAAAYLPKLADVVALLEGKSGYVATAFPPGTRTMPPRPALPAAGPAPPLDFVPPHVEDAAEYAAYATTGPDTIKNLCERKPAFAALVEKRSATLASGLQASCVTQPVFQMAFMDAYGRKLLVPTLFDAVNALDGRAFCAIPPAPLAGPVVIAPAGAARTATSIVATLGRAPSYASSCRAAGVAYDASATPTASDTYSTALAVAAPLWPRQALNEVAAERPQFHELINNRFAALPSGAMLYFFPTRPQPFQLARQAAADSGVHFEFSHIPDVACVLSLLDGGVAKHSERVPPPDAATFAACQLAEAPAATESATVSPFSPAVIAQLAATSADFGSLISRPCAALADKESFEKLRRGLITATAATRGSGPHTSVAYVKEGARPFVAFNEHGQIYSIRRAGDVIKALAGEPYEAEALPRYGYALRGPVRISSAPWSVESLAETQGAVAANATAVPAFPPAIIAQLATLDSRVSALVTTGSAQLGDGRTLRYDEARAQPFYFGDKARNYVARLGDVVRALKNEPFRQATTAN